MVRRVFFSFHYDRDVWRTQEVRNIGSIDGSKPVSPNEWEAVKKGREAAIRRWINNQLKGKSCVIVLIGTETAKREWVKYEIEKAWEEEKGVLGIYIHKLKDRYGKQCRKGANPFRESGLNHIVHAYDPYQTTSKGVYGHIKKNIADWVETAIAIRDEYR